MLTDTSFHIKFPPCAWTTIASVASAKKRVKGGRLATLWVDTFRFLGDALRLLERDAKTFCSHGRRALLNHHVHSALLLDRFFARDVAAKRCLEMEKRKASISMMKNNDPLHMTA